MKLSLKTIEIISCIIACILGTLSHFFYEWSGNNSFIALFSPVNESTWEHLKLIFYPIILISMAEYFWINKKYPHYFCVKFTSALLAMILTIILFYTYSGIYGQNVDFINIAIFYIAMISAYIYSCCMLSTGKNFPVSQPLCITGIILMFLLFCLFTSSPPEIGLFESPV